VEGSRLFETDILPSREFTANAWRKFDNKVILYLCLGKPSLRGLKISWSWMHQHIGRLKMVETVECFYLVTRGGT
jgi:hypothetical protein